MAHSSYLKNEIATSLVLQNRRRLYLFSGRRDERRRPGMFRARPSDVLAQQRAHDARIVTSDLIEALAVLALPALLLSTLSLFLG
jgi:hypothetical protein